MKTPATQADTAEGSMHTSADTCLVEGCKRTRQHHGACHMCCRRQHHWPAFGWQSAASQAGCWVICPPCRSHFKTGCPCSQRMHFWLSERSACNNLCPANDPALTLASTHDHARSALPPDRLIVCFFLLALSLVTGELMEKKSVATECGRLEPVQHVTAARAARSA